ncbi:hypothetical protein L208DRAFT_1395830 [Tricholoma matsutake]|nr:hypothetical protein L208DRAFT_1395830 [Tricholoma matsutake 945]
MLSSRIVPLNVDAQNYPYKTPGRLKSRTENAIYPITLNGKSKDVSKTPFRPPTLQNDKAQGKPVIITTRPAVRPLGDKTPFPNRIGTHQQFQTPLQQTSTFSALSFQEPDTLLQFGKTPDSLLRPSSLRKHVRAPRSGSKNFETPPNNGNHWDISDSSIIVPEAQVQETTTTVEDDCDEIEYMPPNTLDLPYQPPFDFELPTYKDVGKSLLKLAHSYPYDEDDSPAVEITIDEEAVEVTTWKMFALPELDNNDDPFHEPIAVQKKSAESYVHPSIPSKMSWNSRAATKPTKTKDVTTVSKADLIPKLTSTKRIPSAASSAANPIPKTTASGTSRPGTSTSVTTSTILPASKPALRASTLKNPGPGTNRPSAPALKHISSLKGSAAAKVTSKVGSAKATVAVPTTGTIPSQFTTSTRTRAAGTPTAISTRPVRRPATSYKPNATTSSFPLAINANKSGGLASRKRMGPVVGEDTGVDVLVIRSGVGVDDDFRFDV